MSTIEKIKEEAKNYSLITDTPRWAKIVRLVGLAVGSAGASILAANPATLPVALITFAPYMTLLGNFTAIFISGISKK